LDDSDEPGGSQKKMLDFVCAHSLESVQFIEEFFRDHKYSCTFLHSTHTTGDGYYMCWNCECCNICAAEKLTVMEAKMAHSHFKWVYKYVTNGLEWSKSESEW